MYICNNIMTQWIHKLFIIMLKYHDMTAKLREMGLSWGEVQASAKDRTLWQNIVVALCPTGDEEDK